MEYPRMGKKEEEMEPEEEMMSNINLSFDALPEAKDWEDGEGYHIVVRQVSHSKDGAEFEIVDTYSGEEEIEQEDEG
jgi:hypothetical protein